MPPYETYHNLVRTSRKLKGIVQYVVTVKQQNTLQASQLQITCLHPQLMGSTYQCGQLMTPTLPTYVSLTLKLDISLCNFDYKLLLLQFVTLIKALMELLKIVAHITVRHFDVRAVCHRKISRYRFFCRLDILL